MKLYVLERAIPQTDDISEMVFSGVFRTEKAAWKACEDYIRVAELPAKYTPAASKELRETYVNECIEEYTVTEVTVGEVYL